MCVIVLKVLELVAKEWEELDKNKEEIQNWITDVKKELTNEQKAAVGGVKMREKTKVACLTRLSINFAVKYVISFSFLCLTTLLL